MRKDRRYLIIIPSLFTLGATFCGFASMLMAGSATDGTDLWAASYMIGFAGLLDGFDGYMARLTKTQSQFGLQLDSLSDAISFGLAPAWLLYHWGMRDLGMLGFGIAFLYAAACAVRLARFNLTTETTASGFFVGLPSPMGACLTAGFVAMHTGFFEGQPVTEDWQPFVAGYTLFVGFLLVSTVRFMGHKGLGRIRWKQILFVSSLVALVVLSLIFRFEMAFFLIGATYTAVHLVLAVFSGLRRLFGRQAIDSAG